MGRTATLTRMRLRTVIHPVAACLLTELRDERTPTAAFRRLTAELAVLLAFEATRELATEPVQIRTPVGPTTGARPASPPPLLVPVLRAGLGLLDGVRSVLPDAQVGFVGMARDEASLQPAAYLDRLPADLTGRQCFVLDPMLATGGTLVATVRLLVERGASDVTAVCLLAAPEGVATLEQAFSGDSSVNLSLVVAAIDDHLNHVGYIVPGLGDAGDRLYGG